MLCYVVFQLARQPLFFREINPQPRKHTLWQATRDFTSGQAVLHRYNHWRLIDSVIFSMSGYFESCGFILSLTVCSWYEYYIFFELSNSLAALSFRVWVAAFFPYPDPAHSISMDEIYWVWWWWWIDMNILGTCCIVFLDYITINISRTQNRYTKI